MIYSFSVRLWVSWNIVVLCKLTYEKFSANQRISIYVSQKQKGRGAATSVRWNFIRLYTNIFRYLKTSLNEIRCLDIWSYRRELIQREVRDTISIKNDFVEEWKEEEWERGGSLFRIRLFLEVLYNKKWWHVKMGSVGVWLNIRAFGSEGVYRLGVIKGMITPARDKTPISAHNKRVVGRSTGRRL